MDANKIEKFIDAGYTKAEIELLFKDPKVEPEKKEPEKKEPEQKNEKTDSLKMVQNNSQTIPHTDSHIIDMNDFINMNSTIKSLTNTVNSLTETVKAMQTANINSVKTESNKDNTIEGVMQSFIEKL